MSMGEYLLSLGQLYTAVHWKHLLIWGPLDTAIHRENLLSLGPLGTAVYGEHLLIWGPLDAAVHREHLLSLGPLIQLFIGNTY
jgi:hypothetical protein